MTLPLTVFLPVFVEHRPIEASLDASTDRVSAEPLGALVAGARPELLPLAGRPEGNWLDTGWPDTG